MNKTTTSNFWIFKENLIPCLLMLSRIVEYYDFENYELDKIKLGLLNTNIDEDLWFEYSFYGTTKLTFKICNDEEGSGIIFLQVLIVEVHIKELKMCQYLLDEFNIEHRYFKTKIINGQ